MMVRATILPGLWSDHVQFVGHSVRGRGRSVMELAELRRDGVRIAKVPLPARCVRHLGPSRFPLAPYGCDRIHTVKWKVWARVFALSCVRRELVIAAAL